MIYWTKKRMGRKEGAMLELGRAECWADIMFSASNVVTENFDMPELVPGALGQRLHRLPVAHAAGMSDCAYALRRDFRYDCLRAREFSTRGASRAIEQRGAADCNGSVIHHGEGHVVSRNLVLAEASSLSSSLSSDLWRRSRLPSPRPVPSLRLG
jgi:hypothetical protein